MRHPWFLLALAAAHTLCGWSDSAGLQAAAPDAITPAREFRVSAPIWSMAISADGQKLACCGDFGTVAILDAKSGMPVHQLAGHHPDDRVYDVCFSPNGKSLVSAGGDHVIKVWDTVRGELEADLTGHRSWVQCVQFTSDGKFILSADSDTFRIWDAQTGRLRIRHVLESLPEVGVSFRRWATVSPDGRLVATTGKSLELWHFVDGQIRLARKLAESATNEVCEAARFFPDSKTLAAAEFGSGSVHVWDVSTGRRIRTLSHPIPFYATVQLAVSSDGRFVAASSAGRQVVWYAKSGAIRLSLNEGPSVCLAFTPDARFLVTGGDQRVIRFWNLQ
jgi:WD40 repeat protein